MYREHDDVFTSSKVLFGMALDHATKAEMIDAMLKISLEAKTKRKAKAAKEGKPEPWEHMNCDSVLQLDYMRIAGGDISAARLGRVAALFPKDQALGESSVKPLRLMLGNSIAEQFTVEAGFIHRYGP